MPCPTALSKTNLRIQSKFVMNITPKNEMYVLITVLKSLKLCTDIKPYGTAQMLDNSWTKVMLDISCSTKEMLDTNVSNHRGKSLHTRDLADVRQQFLNHTIVAE